MSPAKKSAKKSAKKKSAKKPATKKRAATKKPEAPLDPRAMQTVEMREAANPMLSARLTKTFQPRRAFVETLDCPFCGGTQLSYRLVNELRENAAGVPFYVPLGYHRTCAKCKMGWDEDIVHN